MITQTSLHVPISEVYLQDCIEGMKQYPDKYFDLAIVDPPYGIGADAKNSTDKKQSKKSACYSKKYGEQKWDNHPFRQRQQPNSSVQRRF